MVPCEVVTASEPGEQTSAGELVLGCAGAGTLASISDIAEGKLEDLAWSWV